MFKAMYDVPTVGDMCLVGKSVRFGNVELVLVCNLSEDHTGKHAAKLNGRRGGTLGLDVSRIEWGK